MPLLRESTMRIIWMGAAAAAAALSAGCSEVSTPYPVGTPVSHEEAEAFNGTWQLEEGLVHLRHVGGGRIITAAAEWDGKKGRFELVQDTLVLGRISDGMVVNLPKDDEWDRYDFALVQLLEHGHLLAWEPRVEFFAEAMARGELEGTIHPGPLSTQEVRITSGKAAFDAFLAEQSWSEMFDLKRPIILRRVGPGS